MAGQADDRGGRRRADRRVGCVRPRFRCRPGGRGHREHRLPPGLVPTVSINGACYIDGGVRSPDNADLASGYANVVVLSPLGGRSQAPPGQGADPAGQFEGLRRPPEWGVDLASQVEALRKQGSRVEVVTPDAGSRAAMGTNQMDPACPHPRRPCRFRPRQAGSDPRDAPLTIARRRPALHRHL